MENHTNHSKKQQFSETHDPKTQLENTTKSNSHTTQGQDTKNLDYIYIPQPKNKKDYQSIQKHTHTGIAFKAKTITQQLKQTTPQNHTSDYEKSGIYKIICNTCHKDYVGQTSRDLKSRFREHTRYIKNNDPRSAYALHILNCRHEYGNIENTMDPS